MKRFHTHHITAQHAILEGEEAQHCTKVLRSKTGDQVEILTGNGQLYLGSISNIQKHEVQVTLLSVIREAKDNPNKISVAICPTKNPARIEWFLEKATEIGIAHIYPFISARTEKETIKEERFRQIIISAAKQSGQLFFPTLHPIQKFRNFLDQTEAYSGQKLICHCEDERKLLKDVYTPHSEVLVLIGPEGDFTKEEITTAVNKNYTPISLGTSILRVETAGVVACSMVQMLNEV